MEPNALKRLKTVAGKQTTTLTHYGRNTGKPHEVTIWFVLDGDKPYIGTANLNRQCFRGLLSAFTHVMACTLAESPCDPLHRKLRQLRCLRCRFNCYRVERTSSRAGASPAEVQRLSRRTFSRTIPKWARPSPEH